MESINQEHLLAKLNDLATISPIAIELINKISQNKISRDEIAQLVESDEVIYANVFKYTRSAAMGLHRAPETINEAINILGEHGLLNLIFIIAAKKVFSDLQIWQKSLYTAHLAKSIGEQLNYSAPNLSNLYIATLMHFMGALIFKTFYRKDYRIIEDSVIYTIDDYYQISQKEKELFTLSGAELSFKIGEAYKLPSSIQYLLKNQSHDWKSQEFTQQNAIILTAKLLTDTECTDQKDIEETLDHQFLSYFKLENIKIESKTLNALEKNIFDLAKGF